MKLPTLSLLMLAAILVFSQIAGAQTSPVAPAATVAPVPGLAPDIPAPSMVVNVWPGTAPGETTSDIGEPRSPSNPAIITNVSAPRLLIYRPDDQGGHPAVLVFPGGGYGILSTVGEGTSIAQWLNSLGYVAAVLLYRVPGKRDAAFQDAERAISLVRSRASDFGVDPNHVGVIGFSAGGHLAARLSTQYDNRTYKSIDSADTQSCRPDFTMLIYPAYLTGKKGNQIAPEVQPISDMPPVFLAQTRLDPYFDILPYASALQSASVPFEVLAYDGGGHGYGLASGAIDPVANWSAEAATWLKKMVLLPPHVETAPAVPAVGNTPLPDLPPDIQNGGQNVPGKM